MKAYNRVNRMGVRYTLVELEGGTKIMLTLAPGINIEVPYDIERMNRGWYDYMITGMLIQQAFPFMEASEREFILTGITHAQWKKMFSSKELDIVDHEFVEAVHTHCDCWNEGMSCCDCGADPDDKEVVN